MEPDGGSVHIDHSIKVAAYLRDHFTKLCQYKLDWVDFEDYPGAGIVFVRYLDLAFVWDKMPGLREVIHEVVHEPPENELPKHMWNTHNYAAREHRTNLVGRMAEIALFSRDDAASEANNLTSIPALMNRFCS